MCKCLHYPNFNLCPILKTVRKPEKWKSQECLSLPFLLQRPCSTLQFCASSPDVYTHTSRVKAGWVQECRKSSNHTSSRALAKWEGAQHCSTKPLPAGSSLNQPLGDAPDLHQARTYSRLQMQSCWGIAGFLMGACELASVKELKILITAKSHWLRTLLTAKWEGAHQVLCPLDMLLVSFVY